MYMIQHNVYKFIWMETNQWEYRLKGDSNSTCFLLINTGIKAKPALNLPFQKGNELYFWYVLKSHLADLHSNRMHKVNPQGGVILLSYLGRIFTCHYAYSIDYDMLIITLGMKRLRIVARWLPHCMSSWWLRLPCWQ